MMNPKGKLGWGERVDWITQAERQDGKNRRDFWGSASVLEQMHLPWSEASSRMGRLREGKEFQCSVFEVEGGLET